MKLSSPAFEHNTMIPRKYTCEGLNINPPFTIRDVPPDCRSLALIVMDPDAPNGSFVHWVLYNIPILDVLPENAAPGDQAPNHFGHENYDGPCPQIGTHRYLFKLYALDIRLKQQEEIAESLQNGQLKAHIMKSASLIGLYQKQTRESKYVNT